MPDDYKNLLVEWLGKLPKNRQGAGLSLLARADEANVSDIIAGLLALAEATGSGIVSSFGGAAESAKSVEAAMKRTEEAAKLLDTIPADLAKRLLAAIDLDGLAKAVAAGLNKSIAVDTVAAAAKAAKGVADNLTFAHKGLSEVAPHVEAHTRALTESAKGLAKTAESVLASEARQLDLVRHMAQSCVTLELGQRSREWAIAALLSAILVGSFTWWLRGCFQPAPDLISMVDHHGGGLAVSGQKSGLVLYVRGGTETMQGGWHAFTFSP